MANLEFNDHAISFEGVTFSFTGAVTAIITDVSLTIATSGSHFQLFFDSYDMAKDEAIKLIEKIGFEFVESEFDTLVYSRES